MYILIVLFLAGVISIRAYNAQETFKDMNRKKVNFNATEIFALKYAQS